ncbi:MAG: Asp23/Gls24 family envelope stress response protein [Sulfobacillus sp.]
MQVLGLIGASGTGKSHRASLVAIERGYEAIVDDGLLIKEGKILAGQSAKRAASKIQAIRRAIFTDSGHAREVRETISRHQISHLLVLGTSRSMVSRICAVLELPEPIEWIRIEQLANPAQIRLARQMRTQHGRHVIPAPTVEVRKTFSGYLVDPLHFIMRNNKAPHGKDQMVIEKSVVRPTWSYLGRFTVDDTVIADIASRAAAGVSGVAGIRRAGVESWQPGVRITLELTVVFGSHIPTLLEAVRRRVETIVEQMTALKVLTVVAVVRRVVPVEDRGSRVSG